VAVSFITRCSEKQGRGQTRNRLIWKVLLSLPACCGTLSAARCTDRVHRFGSVTRSGTARTWKERRRPLRLPGGDQIA